jgi:hypothetical protein
MTGESEITGFIKKNGLGAAVKQFGQEAVDADGKLVGKKWVPNAAAPKPAAAEVAKPAEEAAKPVAPTEAAPSRKPKKMSVGELLEAARSGGGNAAAKAGEAAATTAARTLPADAPSLEEMQGLAKKWGVSHEGLSDLELFDALDAKANELRKANGPTTFEAPAKPPIGTTIRQRRKPGDVVEGENLPGEDGEVFPDIPQDMLPSEGDLSTNVTPPPKGPAKLTPGTGRMPSQSSSTAAKPAPEGVVTSSNGKPRVVDGTKESKPVPPPVPAASTTHISNPQPAKSYETTSEDEVWPPPKAKPKEGRAAGEAYDPSKDLIEDAGPLPEPPPGPTLIDRIVGPKDKRWGNVARIAGIAAVPPIAGMVLGERDAPPATSSDPSKAFSHWNDATASAPSESPDATPAPAPAPEAPVHRGGPPGLNWPDATGGGDAAAAPRLGGAAGEQAINRAAGGADNAIDPAEAERLSRVLKSVAAARMYGYGQYGPAY